MSHHVVYACYWKNESRKNLHSSGDGEAYKVVSSGNDFYIAGWTASNKSMANVRATYWKNGGNKKRLSKGTRYQSIGGSWSSEARGITVVDGKVYIAGKSDYYNMEKVLLTGRELQSSNPSKIQMKRRTSELRESLKA